MPRGVRTFLEGLVLVVSSQVLLTLGGGMLSFLAMAPVLLFSINHGTGKTVVLSIVNIMVILLWNVILDNPAEGGKLGWIFLMLYMYFPLSLSAAGIVWLKTRGDHRLIGRLLKTLLPSLLLLAVYALVIFTDKALPQAIMDSLRNVFAGLFVPLTEYVFPGLDVNVFFDLVMFVFGSILFPVLLASICAGCFIYETALHSRESGWEREVMAFGYPPDAVWGFIISWALVLLLRFVSAPLLLEIAAMDVAGIWSVLYAIQGFTVITARIRRRHENVRSMTIFIVLAVFGLLVPGINLIILIGLPIIGALESFSDLKKMEADYEDYS